MTDFITEKLEEFDRQFTYKEEGTNKPVPEVQNGLWWLNVKDFITKTLKAHEAHVRGEIVGVIDKKIEEWNFDRHHCTYGNACEDRCYKEKWHAYCGFELDHGIEAEELVEELQDIKSIIQK